MTREVRTGLLPCTGAALLSLVLPGLGHVAVRARWRPVVRVATAVDLVAVSALVAAAVQLHGRVDVVELVADRGRFVLVGFALLTMVVTRLWSACDAAWRARPTAGTVLRGVAAGTVAVVVVGGVAPLAIAADYVWQTDRAVERVFSDAEPVTANPTPLASPAATASSSTVSATATSMTWPAVTSSTTAATTTTTPPTTTTTLPSVVGEDRVNLLLLGGDAGPGRWNLRTDSMVVVSVQPFTGDTVMISVPRNMQHLPFPAGTTLAARYPHGFTDLANAVYPIVDTHRELMGGVDDAGAQAIKLGIAQLLGMPIHYYVLVDMAGFVDVIDALGGIDLDVAHRVPAPGNPPGAKHDVPAWIEVGSQHMDGTIALAYARSRSADSDYQRMTRQRCVLASIADAATPHAVATRLPDLMAAFGAAVRTDIPRDRLGDVAAVFDRFLAAGGLSTVRTLQLTPPLVQPRSWSAAAVRRLVAGVVDPVPAGAPASAAPPAPAPVLAQAC